MSSNRHDDFHSTRWSLVVRARDDHDHESQEALNDLCAIYWYPIYAYIRRRGNSPQETEDLTQGYFMSLLERDYLSRADREKGRLREFLLTDVKFFLSSKWREKTARKRGGGATHIPIDIGWAEEHYQHEPAETTTPETLFERRWALTVLQRVMDQLEAHYRKIGSEEMFKAVRGYLTWNSGEKPYAEVADDLGTSVGNVKTAVNRLRKRYRKLLEEEVLQTVAEPAEVEAEIRHMAAAMG